MNSWLLKMLRAFDISFLCWIKLKNTILRRAIVKSKCPAFAVEKLLTSTQRENKRTPLEQCDLFPAANYVDAGEKIHLKTKTSGTFFLFFHTTTFNFDFWNDFTHSNFLVWVAIKIVVKILFFQFFSIYKFQNYKLFNFVFANFCFQFVPNFLTNFPSCGKPPF